MKYFTPPYQLSLSKAEARIWTEATGRWISKTQCPLEARSSRQHPCILSPLFLYTFLHFHSQWSQFVLGHQMFCQAFVSHLVSPPKSSFELPLDWFFQKAKEDPMYPSHEETMVLLPRTEKRDKLPSRRIRALRKHSSLPKTNLILSLPLNTTWCVNRPSMVNETTLCNPSLALYHPAL